MDVEALAAEVLRQAVRSPNAAEAGWRDVVVGFYHAVNWGEPLVVGLLSLHAALLAAVLGLRRVFWAQVVVFFLLMGLLALAEPLNGLARRNWRAIATQNYFDAHGVFASALFAGPLLFVSLVQLVSLLLLTSHYLIVSKRAQLRAKGRSGAGSGERAKLKDE